MRHQLWGAYAKDSFTSAHLQQRHFGLLAEIRWSATVVSRTTGRSAWRKTLHPSRTTPSTDWSVWIDLAPDHTGTDPQAGDPRLQQPDTFCSAAASIGTFTTIDNNQSSW